MTMSRPSRSRGSGPRSSVEVDSTPYGPPIAFVLGMTAQLHWLFLVWLIALSSGCGGTEEAAPPNSRVASSGVSSPDAEMLFRGLVLGHGYVAQLVPEIRDHLGLDAAPLTPEQRAQALSLFDEIMMAIENHHPELLVWFETEISSGDHYRVAAALDRGRRAVLEVMPHTSVGLQPNEVAGALDEGLTAAVVAVWAVAVAVHTWAAAHHMVAVSTIGWRFVIAYSEFGERTRVHGGLLGEEMVDSIVRRVAPLLPEAR